MTRHMFFRFKDAVPVSFSSILFTSYILTIFKNVKNNTEKNVFVVNVWPAKFALFIYVSTHCVEKVK